MKTVESAIAEAERLGLEIWGIGRQSGEKPWCCSIRAFRIENGKKVFYYGVASGGTPTEAAHAALVGHLTNLLDTTKVIDAAKIPRKRAEDWV